MIGYRRRFARWRTSGISRHSLLSQDVSGARSSSIHSLIFKGGSERVMPLHLSISDTVEC